MYMQLGERSIQQMYVNTRCLSCIKPVSPQRLVAGRPPATRPSDHPGTRLFAARSRRLVRLRQANAPLGTHLLPGLRMEPRVDPAPLEVLLVRLHIVAQPREEVQPAEGREEHRPGRHAPEPGLPHLAGRVLD